MTQEPNFFDPSNTECSKEADLCGVMYNHSHEIGSAITLDSPHSRPRGPALVLIGLSSL